jgi:hypothetical protein
MKPRASPAGIHALGQFGCSLGAGSTLTPSLASSVPEHEESEQPERARSRNDFVAAALSAPTNVPILAAGELRGCEVAGIRVATAGKAAGCDERPIHHFEAPKRRYGFICALTRI